MVYEDNQDMLDQMENLNPKIKTVQADPSHTLDYHLGQATAIAILERDHSKNLKILKSVRNKYPEKYVLTVARDHAETEEMLRNGANQVVEGSDSLAKMVLKKLGLAAQRQSMVALAREIKGVSTRGLAIFLQDNPDSLSDE